MKEGKPACLFKNCIKFVVTTDINANITLIYTHQWIELHAEVIGTDVNRKACLLRDIITSGLSHAAEVQRYDDLVPHMAFFCPCGESKFDHLASVDHNKQFLHCMADDGQWTKLTNKHYVWLHSASGESCNYCTVL